MLKACTVAALIALAALGSDPATAGTTSDQDHPTRTGFAVRNGVAIIFEGGERVGTIQVPKVSRRVLNAGSDHVPRWKLECGHGISLAVCRERKTD